MKMKPAPVYSSCLKNYHFNEGEGAFMAMLDAKWLEHCKAMTAFTPEGVEARRNALADRVRSGDHAAGLEFAKLPSLEAEVAQTRAAGAMLTEQFNAGFAAHWPTLKAIGERLIPAFDKLIERHLADIMGITAEIAEPMAFQETSVLRWLRSKRDFVAQVCQTGSQGWATAEALFAGVIESPEAE
jgi:hypothetical protein